MAAKTTLPSITLSSPDGQMVTIRFSDTKAYGRGAFGVVYPAVIVETGESVAIKRVVQDDRYENRELQIMKTLFHPNIVRLRRFWEEPNSSPAGTMLSLVMEFIPDTVHRVIQHYNERRTMMPAIVMKLYVYQICRALGYLHARKICHRDLKPQNLLCNTKTHVLKICDFGSAKQLTEDKPSLAYVCSRFYRAPELVFGATHYTVAVDMWSVGCVFAELMQGSPTFPGPTTAAHKIEIIKILGTPTREDMRAMNPENTDTDIPVVSKMPWSSLLKGRTTPEATDLLDRMLTYNPKQRITAIEALAHPFFDELRNPATKLPTGQDLPPLFNITSDELTYIPIDLLEKIVPIHARNPSNWPGPIPSATSISSISAAMPASDRSAPSRAKSDLPSPTAPPAASLPSRDGDTAASFGSSHPSSYPHRIQAPQPARPSGIASRTLGFFSSLTTRAPTKSAKGSPAPSKLTTDGLSTKSMSVGATSAPTAAGDKGKFPFSSRTQPSLKIGSSEPGKMISPSSGWS